MEFENSLVMLKKSKQMRKGNMVLIMKSIMAGFKSRTPRLSVSVLSFHPKSLDPSMCSVFFF